MRGKQPAPAAAEAAGAAASAPPPEAAGAASPTAPAAPAPGAAGAPAADDLFTRLSDAGRELVPVAYRFVPVSPVTRATIMRLVESRPYRATGYVCGPFHKPISKCCDADEPRDDE